MFNTLSTFLSLSPLLPPLSYRRLTVVAEAGMDSRDLIATTLIGEYTTNLDSKGTLCLFLDKMRGKEEDTTHQKVADLLIMGAYTENNPELTRHIAKTS